MIYDTLLQLPVFQGITTEQLTLILDKTPFQFHKYKEGELICASGEQCEGLRFILNGTVNQQMSAFEGKVCISQDFEGPHTMPFYYLFGAQITSPSKLMAKSDVGVMELDKKHFLQLLQSHEICLVNVLNMLSTHAQKQHVAIDFVGKDNGMERLASWLLAFTERQGRDIQILANETAWCQMLHMQPTEFWRNVAILEGKKIVESSGVVLKLIDRYALRGIVNSK